jgi:hypothetical protein
LAKVRNRIDHFGREDPPDAQVRQPSKHQL